MSLIAIIMANESITSTQFPTNLPIFKGENYEGWVAQMKVIFRFQDVAEIVCDGVPTSEVNANDVQKDAHKEQRKKDEKNSFLDSLMYGFECVREDH